MAAEISTPLTDGEAQALVAGSPLATALAPGVALLILGGAPTRVAYANPAARALFNAADDADLERIAVGAPSPGARRLSALAYDPAGARTPRLESLRFFALGLPLHVTLACARAVGGRGDDYLVAVAPGAARAAREAPVTASAAAIAAAVPGAAADAPAKAARFLWAVDAQAKFLAPLDALAAILGAAAPHPGEGLAELGERTGFDANQLLAEALQAQKTFAGLGLLWPARNGRARGLSLSGAPQWDREGNFAGFRGFGVFAAEAVEPAPIDGEARAKKAPAPKRDDGAAAGDRPSERSAEIVTLRKPPPAGAQKVVALRPAARAPQPVVEIPGRGENSAFVELTSDERDAFREIARALGAKPRGGEAAPRPPARTDAATPPVEPARPAPAKLEARAPAPRDILDLMRDLAPSAAPLAAPAPEPPRARAEPIDAAAANARDILDRLPLGAMVTRGEDALYLNRTLLDLLGYASLQAFRDADGLSRTFRGRAPASLTPDGGGRALPIVDARGEVIAVDGQILAVAWDGAPATLISLRRALEPAFQAQLRAAERDAQASRARAMEMSGALDVACAGAILLDASGCIVSLSAGAEGFFGYGAKEVAGETFRVLFAPPDGEAAFAALESLRAGGEAQRAEIDVVARRQDGEDRPVRLRLGSIDAAGEARHCVTLHDPSEAGAEPAAVRPDRLSALQSEFLAQTSHEIRTPLHAMLGFAELMAQERFGPLGNARYKAYVNDIHASGMHVLSLVNDLLDLAKIEAGKLELNPSAVDANQVIRECVALMQPQAERERVIMRAALCDPPPFVLADERSLRQILLNLIANAVKFNEPGGQVIVSSGLDESGAALIRVRDTGAGMDEAEIGAAMKPFAQLARGRRAGGTGLGLPLTKALVEANNASFAIRSRKEQGTMVELAFPLAQAAAQ